MALKVLRNDHVWENGQFRELEAARSIRQQRRSHPASRLVRAVLDSFEIPGPDGEHLCLIHELLREDLVSLQARAGKATLPLPLIKVILMTLLWELDFLHRCCHIIHTGMLNRNLFSENPGSGFGLATGTRELKLVL